MKKDEPDTHIERTSCNESLILKDTTPPVLISSRYSKQKTSYNRLVSFQKGRTSLSPCHHYISQPCI
jgi:hypothetical protein